MKSIFLIAAALVAAPALCPDDDHRRSGRWRRMAMPAPAGQPMGTMSPGGYQPAMPAVQGTPTPGCRPDVPGGADARTGLSGARAARQIPDLQEGSVRPVHAAWRPLSG